MNNVETFAHVPRILADGAGAWKARGRERRGGAQVHGAVRRRRAPGRLRGPDGHHGARAHRRRTAAASRAASALLGFMPGGASTAFLPASKVDTPLSFDALRAAGSALGSGAVAGARTRAATSSRSRPTSCGSSATSPAGSASPAASAARRRSRSSSASSPGTSSANDLEALPALHETLSLSSICGLGQVALVPAISVLENFPERMRPRPTGSGPKSA